MLAKTSTINGVTCTAVGSVNNSLGVKLGTIPNPYSELLASDWLDKIKANNKKVYYVQEGPHWMYTELEVADQIRFYNMLIKIGRAHV